MDEFTWLGTTTSKRIIDDDASKWAQANSIPDVQPGRFGWTEIGHSYSKWFSVGPIACGGDFVIPHRVFQGKIAIKGMTREQVLQMYQTEFVAAHKDQGAALNVQRKWAMKSNPP
jgi:hypothetical protein